MRIAQGRFPGAFEDEFFLVSYTILPDFQSGQRFYGGYQWDLNLLKIR